MSEKPAEKDRSQLPVELKINGQTVKARPGQTVLQVVQEQGLDDIPNLCYDPKLEPFGSCFLCVVEVKGARGMVPSCTTRVRDGMEVTTNSEKIQYARKTALELLLSDHYADCLCPGQVACPAGVDVQGYVSLADLGHYDQALSLIKERNPLPVVCGRVCVRKCEVNCRRNLVDEPVGINFVKRFVAEAGDRKKSLPEKKPATGKKVAIVGGGPAGLSCAYYLALLGHQAKIFEAMPALGGMLRWGIPEYRLPKAELDREISEILGLGVEVALGRKLGKDFTIASLREKDKFDAVFLALGAPLGKKMEVPGEDAEGIESGLDFLRDSVLKGPRKLHGKVVVVGGGNSAIDAARTALRSGASEVAILYRRTRKEMPAHHEEVDAAEKEGAKLEILAAPIEVISQNGRLKALKCIRMELGAPDASGRRSPVPIKGSEFEYPCDFVFAAIGQGIDPDPIKQEAENLRPALGRGGVIKVEEVTMVTSVPGVFAGGDVVLGPSVVIDAIAQGRRAAMAIDQYLATGELKKTQAAFVSRRDLFGTIPERMFDEVKKSPRHHLPEREPLERKHDFKEFEFSLSEPDMKAEAQRCLECGCQAQFECLLRDYATRYNVEVLRLSGAVRRHKVDASHPLITLDPNKCILCGRCVRTCAEILDLSVFGFVGRGFTTVIKPALGRPLIESPCISCGACVETCPTGALTAKLPYGRQGPWKSERVPSVCGFCSLGCALDLNVVTDGLLWAKSPAGAGIWEGDLCYKGRFGTGLIQCRDRIARPMIRRGTELRESSWEEALKFAARILEESQKRNGPDSVAVLAVPRMTLEECYLTGRLARGGLGANLIGSFGQFRRGGPRRDLDEIMGETVSTCRQDDLYSADLVLVVGADPSSTHPVLGMKVRRAARKGGRVVVLNSNNTDLAHSSKLWLDPRRGAMGILLAGVLRRILDRAQIQPPIPGLDGQELNSLRESLQSASLDEVARIAGVDPGRLEELAELIAGARNLVAIYDLDETIERATDDLPILAQILLLTGHLARPGSGLLLLQADCNSEGARLAGMRENQLPGGIDLNDTDYLRKVAGSWEIDPGRFSGKARKGFSEMLASGKLKGALVILEDPYCDPEADRLLGKLEALVVVDQFLTETAKLAQVVLPASTLAETSGTIVSFDRQLRAVNRADHPVAGKTTAEVLVRLGKELGHSMPSDPEKIRAELSALMGISPQDLEKARNEQTAWPVPGKFLRFQRLQKIQLSAEATVPIRFAYASLDGYLRRRLLQMGMPR